MRDNRDFDIKIEKNIEADGYTHSYIELFYLVTGSCTLTVGDQNYLMKQRDLILVNAMETYHYAADGIVCIFRIAYRTFLRFAPGEGCIFFLNSTKENREVYEDIRHLIHEMIWLEAIEKRDRECRIYRDFYGLMDIMLLHCRDISHEAMAGQGDIDDDMKRRQMIAYVHSNYRDTISLSTLAGHMFVSTSTLSRFFRKKTGTYFADYVNKVRLTYAIGEMRYTSKNLTKIAADCGFSSASSFATLFHQAYGMNPNAYRKKLQLPQEISMQEQKLREEAARQIAPEHTSREQMNIIIDADVSQKYNQPFPHVITVGSLSALTRTNVQYHLLYAVKELHITHVRIWSVFSEDMRVTDGKTIGVYNYNAIDNVLDRLVENHIGVYFDFGRRPDIAVRTQDAAVFQEETDIHFKTRRNWEALFEDFVQHLVARYGIDEIKEWYFDFNQDPSYKGECAYADDPDYSFSDVWRHAFWTIRQYAPGARIGGPVGIPNGHKDMLSAFLKEAQEANCPPDFLSIVLFPYEPTKDYQSFTRVLDPDYEPRMLAKIEAMLKEMGMEDLPVHVSDWNLSLSTRNVINDSCFRGAYLASKAGMMMKYVKICSIWILSDWVSSHYDSRAILNGGCGLLTRDSIRKPAWFALQFMCRLGQSVLYEDSHLVVTRQRNDDFMILASNSVQFDVNYYLRNEDELRAEDVEMFVLEGEKLKIQLNLKGLGEGGEFIVKTRSVSRSHGSILDEWKRLRCEVQLERSDVKYLQEICVPSMSIERREVEGNFLTIPVSLEPQEFCLIHVYRSR